MLPLALNRRCCSHMGPLPLHGAQPCLASDLHAPSPARPSSPARPFSPARQRAFQRPADIRDAGARVRNKLAMSGLCQARELLSSSHLHLKAGAQALVLVTSHRATGWVATPRRSPESRSFPALLVPCTRGERRKGRSDP